MRLSGGIPGEVCNDVPAPCASLQVANGGVAAVVPDQGHRLAVRDQEQERHSAQEPEGQQGQVIEKAVPLHVSNVALVENDKPVRARYELKDGKKTRISTKSGNKI